MALLAVPLDLDYRQWRPVILKVANRQKLTEMSVIILLTPS